MIDNWRLMIEKTNHKTIKAITLWQPWASLMVHGLKQIETRSWSTKYRGPLGIHAAKKIMPYTNIRLQVAVEDMLHMKLWELPRGAFIGVCDLVGCEKIRISNRPDYPETIYGDYTPGRFMWFVDGMLPLGKPIPMRGYQRLWNAELS